MSVLPTPPATGADRSARGILAAAALVLVLLFGSASRGQFACLFAPDTATKPQVVGATVSGIDCHGYYAWLRSLLINGDWRFRNEYDFYRAHHPGLDGHYPDVSPGRAPNQWSVGPALVWSVGVVPVHLLLTATGTVEEEPRGYSPPYQLAVGAVTLALALAALGFVYGIARAFAPPVASAAAAAAVVLGTSVGAYGAAMGGMAHGPAAAALAGYVWVWVRTFGSARPGRWFAVGLLLGFACLMRWQLATFAVLPALEAVWLVRQNWRRPARPLGLGVCAAVGAVVGFVPQMIAWSVVYGRPLVNPHPTAAEWLAPSFWRVLFSADRSLFYWTPVALFGVLGLLVAARPGRGDVRARFLLAAFAIQVYAVAALVDRGVDLGSSFGFRLLTEAVVVLVVGLAVLFRFVAPRRPTLLALACGAAVCWNLLLLWAYCHSVPGADGGPPGAASAVVRYVVRRPIDASLWGVAAVALALRLCAGFRTVHSEPDARASSPEAVGVFGRLLRRFGRAPAR